MPRPYNIIHFIYLIVAYRYVLFPLLSCVYKLLVSICLRKSVVITVSINYYTILVLILKLIYTCIQHYYELGTVQDAACDGSDGAAEVERSIELLAAWYLDEHLKNPA